DSTLLKRFFFSSRRRHTRWPRDWSSDVCSSDLPRLSWTISAPPAWRQAGYELEIVRGSQVRTHAVRSPEQILVAWPEAPLASRRSEERRVGKERRSRWRADDQKKK